MGRAAWSRALALATALAPAAAGAAHKFDLAQKMPPHLAIAFTMAWFGVSAKDPQGAGGDPGYANWTWNDQGCNLVVPNDPTACSAFAGAGLQREVASKRRPLAGIYSASGRTDESLRRIDLMLSTVRRPCDSGARLDAFAVQLSSVMFTSQHPNNQQSVTWDIAWRALGAFLDRADAAGMKGAVMVADDSTVYWHFGDNFGLTTQAQRKAALTADLAEVATLAASRSAATKIGGKPLILIYLDAALMTPDEWTAVLDGARAQSGVDFYTLGTTLNGTYFAAFDALAPWLNLGVWAQAQGATVHDQAQDWEARLHAQLIAALPGFAGREIVGSVTPGFDDATADWGQCMAREIPRDPALLDGELDWLAAEKSAGTLPVRGLVVETWDDWTEGSEIEPDVTDGAAKLVQLRQRIGALFGEAPDPAGDAALAARWSGYGQARNCCFAGGGCDGGTSAPVELACPPPPDGGSDAAAPADSGADLARSAVRDGTGAPDLAESAPGKVDCGCRIGASRGRPSLPVALIALALVSSLLRRGRARRCRRAASSRSR